MSRRPLFLSQRLHVRCTKEACAFTQHFDDIKKLNAVIIGIRPDSLEIHEKFARQYRLAFALGSETGLELART